MYSKILIVILGLLVLGGESLAQGQPSQGQKQIQVGGLRLVYSSGVLAAYERVNPGGGH